MEPEGVNIWDDDGRAMGKKGGHGTSSFRYALSQLRQPYIPPAGRFGGARSRNGRVTSLQRRCVHLCCTLSLQKCRCHDVVVSIVVVVIVYYYYTITLQLSLLSLPEAAATAAVTHTWATAAHHPRNTAV